MDEYISKQTFKEKYLCCGWLPEMSEEEFDAFPAADVAPVVRCRDCKFYREFRTKRYNQIMRLCCRMGKRDMEYPVNSVDFCSYGRRKIETILPKSEAKDESLEGDQ